MLSDLLVRQMVDAMPMPVFVKDEAGRHVYVNRAFEMLFRVRADSLSSVADHPALSSLPDRITESTTFCTADGDRYTMTLIHTESFAPRHDVEVEELRAELRATKAELARMRETDPVTQAVSRRALRAHTEDAFAAAPAGVLRISVDDLGSIVTTFGEDTGDELLARFSDIVRANTRPNDVFARTSDHEFTLILREADREQTEMVARRICEAVTDARTKNGHAELALSVTVGAAYSDAADAQLSTLIDTADQARRSATPCRNEAIVA